MAIQRWFGLVPLDWTIQSLFSNDFLPIHEVVCFVCAGICFTMFSLSHVLQTAETLLSYRNEEFLCDTILVAKDCQLKAHSVVLAAVSPVFKTAFCTGTFSGGTFQVDLPDVDSEVLQTALDFIYTGELVLPSPAYASPGQLSTLFSTLQDLGLDIQKLNGSEMKFKRYTYIKHVLKLVIAKLY